jgi:hypothetical protein
MKVKKYLPVYAMVCAGALTLAGCSDYDNNECNEAAIQFEESFYEAFGRIDPQQDWNLAERAMVTVNTQTASNIKIYAQVGNEYMLVGDYEGVSGTQKLGVDIVEGTRALIVTDGCTAQTCAPGDEVSFIAVGTRTTYSGNGFVQVSKLTGDVEDLGDGKIHPQYVYKSEADYQQLIAHVPETKPNLNKVTANFSYVSNGPFIIYPYYWNTKSYNTIGVYYYDAQGNRIDVDVYKIKESNAGEDSELMYEENGEYHSTNNKQEPGHVTRGLGVKVDIPKGTKFGMYLKKTDTAVHNGVHESKNYELFSESKLNDPAVLGNGVKVDETGKMIQVEGKYPCYAATFAIGDDMFFGFEDWPNDGWADGKYSDFDFNDLVFTIKGIPPYIINEEPKTWVLACEDLGGTFDRDYNDVIFKVEHTSGQPVAHVTPLAAGGTLASYIFYVNGNTQTCLGEVHQLFGAEPAVSGKYKIHNVGTSRGKEGKTINITVPVDWSLAYCSTNEYTLAQGVNDAGWQNMGGFEIRTLKKGTEPIENAEENWQKIKDLSSGESRIPAPNKGAAPYIICFPYSYTELNAPETGWKTETFFAWTQEFVTIDGCYPAFPLWVKDHKTAGAWYTFKKDGAAVVSELKNVRNM